MSKPSFLNFQIFIRKQQASRQRCFGNGNFHSQNDFWVLWIPISTIPNTIPGIPIPKTSLLQWRIQKFFMGGGPTRKFSKICLVLPYFFSENFQIVGEKHKGGPLWFFSIFQNIFKNHLGSLVFCWKKLEVKQKPAPQAKNFLRNACF